MKKVLLSNDHNLVDLLKKQDGEFVVKDGEKLYEALHGAFLINMVSIDQWNFLRNPPPPLVVWCCETRGGVL